MERLSMGDIGRRLTKAGRLTLRPLCVYGSEEPPSRGIPSTEISSCIAKAIFTSALFSGTPPIYVGEDTLEDCCGGGAAMFGFRRFAPGIKYFVSTGTKSFRNGAAEYLRASPELVEENQRLVGRITPPGRYVVIQACDDLSGDDPGVRSVLCFAGAEQARNLCGLVHFHSVDPFTEVLVPQGPSCASFVSFAAGMAERAPENAVFLGPCDPTGNSWFPPDMMSIAIPIKMARRMCDDLANSFIVKRSQVAYPRRRSAIEPPGARKGRSVRRT